MKKVKIIPIVYTFIGILICFCVYSGIELISIGNDKLINFINTPAFMSIFLFLSLIANILIYRFSYRTVRKEEQEDEEYRKKDIERAVRMIASIEDSLQQAYITQQRLIGQINHIEFSPASLLRSLLSSEEEQNKQEAEDDLRKQHLMNLIDKLDENIKEYKELLQHYKDVIQKPQAK